MSGSNKKLFLLVANSEFKEHKNGELNYSVPQSSVLQRKGRKGVNKEGMKRKRAKREKKGRKRKKKDEGRHKNVGAKIKSSVQIFSLAPLAKL